MVASHMDTRAPGVAMEGFSMSIWSDNAIKEMQEKIAWLEKEVAVLKAEADERKNAAPTRLGLNGSRKPS
jgi:uncharacterized small protein (DUF1192 family)